MRHLLILLCLTMLPTHVHSAVLAAARTLQAGTIIAPADLRAIDGKSAGISDPASAIGKQVRVTIYEGRPIHANLLQTPRLVSRNQTVSVTFQRGPLQVKAQGRALSDGGAGDIVRVMNTDSRKIIFVRVQPNGTLLAGF
ncbi:flagellar basal body P-ring formation chaperone FlgA [Paracoccus sp. Z330]|uniref:Flagella basal body P-ring formation protein FlgA n=1 Tax=Paracoccus onchidii TaxID=3017813 RepID=A0ABT4ZBB5_9RHOB|nr:flagellar basal body P-ring formation chaperone FlgA [Paracoccus onchidii]MDB6176661.1 flagellar basal body P-ring formation chaperone FlgA [Paracoccus onchidii]